MSQQTGMSGALSESIAGRATRGQSAIARQNPSASRGVSPTLPALQYNERFAAVQPLRKDVAVLESYRAHVAERAALGLSLIHI